MAYASATTVAELRDWLALNPPAWDLLLGAGATLHADPDCADRAGTRPQRLFDRGRPARVAASSAELCLCECADPAQDCGNRQVVDAVGLLAHLSRTVTPLLTNVAVLAGTTGTNAARKEQAEHALRRLRTIFDRALTLGSTDLVAQVGQQPEPFATFTHDLVADWEQRYRTALSAHLARHPAPSRTDDLVYALVRANEVTTQALLRPLQCRFALTVQPLVSYRAGDAWGSAMLGFVASREVLRQVAEGPGDLFEILGPVEAEDEPAAVLRVVAAAGQSRQGPPPPGLLATARAVTQPSA